MDDRPHLVRKATRLSTFVAMLALLSAGCTTGPFGLGGINGRHRLLDSTQALRHTSPTDLPRELNKSLLTAYILEPGDGLLVQPADLDSPARLPGDQTILPDGTIDLGRYGRLRVAGLTIDAVEAMVKTAVLSQTPDAGPVTVRLVNRQSKVYYVIGEVNTPGAFPYSGRETVLDAIQAAGGTTERASESNIILSRPSPPDGCRTVLPICYPEIVQHADTSTNYQISPGDRIYVPSKTFFESLCGSKKPCPACLPGSTACPEPSRGSLAPQAHPLPAPPSLVPPPAAVGPLPTPVSAD